MCFAVLQEMAFIGSGKSSPDFSLVELKEELYAAVIRSIDANKIDFSRGFGRNIHVARLLFIRDLIDSAKSVKQLREFYFKRIVFMITP